MRLRLQSLSSAQLRVAVFLAALAIAVIPAGLHAWGDAGHRITGEAAALRLPLQMPAFFRAASKQLAYLNPEPDRWKDKAESSIDHALDDWAYPDHFIDMDLIDTTVLNAALKAPHRYARRSSKGQFSMIFALSLLRQTYTYKTPPCGAWVSAVAGAPAVRFRAVRYGGRPDSGK